MEMDKYKNFSESDFLDDHYFLQWLTYRFAEDEEIWMDFLKSYPSKVQIVRAAESIFNLLRVREREMNLPEQFELWNRIRIESVTSEKNVWVKLVKYAAVLICVFCSGALSFYLYQDKPIPVYNRVIGSVTFEDSTKKYSNLKALLILSDGSKIPLERQLSKISYNYSGNQLVVNQDTIKQEAGFNSGFLNRVSIPYGKKSIIELSDGTKVWLNAGSQIAFPTVFSGAFRKVELKGEAFFEVAKNAERPFLVETCDQVVHVVGTKFNVSAYPEDKFVQTVLQEGKVSLEIRDKKLFKKDHFIEMDPDQMIELDKESKEIFRSVVDASKYIMWRDDILEFNKIDLGKALKQIERFYDIQITLADPKIALYKLSGKLDLKENPEDVLNVIKLTVPIAWRKTNKNFKLTEK